MFYQNVMDRKEVAKILKDAIMNEYVSIMEYARVTGQEYKKVHSWTCGNRLPEIEDIVATCNILKIPLEYVLVGTNREVDDDQMEEDELAARARGTYPNPIFADAALIFPLIEMRRMIDIICRAGDCRDSRYIYNLFRKTIQVETAAWKYCVYILQQRNSPLVYKIKKIEVNQEELMIWNMEYEKKKYEFWTTYENIGYIKYKMEQPFFEGIKSGYGEDSLLNN